MTTVNDTGCMWAGILGWTHSFDKHGVCPCGARQTRNPLAVGTFCETCGTRTSDKDHAGSTREHPCPVCDPRGK